MRVEYVLKRLAQMVLTLLLSSMLLFALIRLAPGDPVKLFLGDPEIALTNTAVYEKRYEEMRKELRLDRSLLIQYTFWLSRVIRLDFGSSIFTRQPVGKEILDRLPATLVLALPSLALQSVLGVLMGIGAAVNHGRALDQLIRFLCVFLASVPAFALGLSFLYFFGVKYHLYAITNVASADRLWLPALILALAMVPALSRMIRGSMLQELGRPYSLAAVARGVKKSLVMAGAFQNILLPVITMIAMSFTSLISGAVVIENIFSWPGIGKYALDSILRHDYPVIQGYGFITLFLIILCNFCVDLLYVAVNPSLKKERLQ